VWSLSVQGCPNQQCSRRSSVSVKNEAASAVLMLKNRCPHFRTTGTVVPSFRTITLRTLLKYAPSLSASARHSRNSVGVPRTWYVTVPIGLWIRTVPWDGVGPWPPKLIFVVPGVQSTFVRRFSRR
jgi:hypothetical protein